ncbi:MAG: SpoIIE family protein phosphatase [Pseudomonadota bacterium]
MIQGLRHRIKLITGLKLAEEVQQNLLPRKAPAHPGLDIAGASIYCDETGGDYYDYLRLPGGRLGIVVVGTDGIHETRNEAGEMFGHHRLREAIRKHTADSAENIKNAVIESLRVFRGDAPQEDDITLVVIRLL